MMELRLDEGHGAATGGGVQAARKHARARLDKAQPVNELVTHVIPGQDVCS